MSDTEIDNIVSLFSNFLTFSNITDNILAGIVINNRWQVTFRENIYYTNIITQNRFQECWNSVSPYRKSQIRGLINTGVHQLKKNAVKIFLFIYIFPNYTKFSITEQYGPCMNINEYPIRYTIVLPDSHND